MPELDSAKASCGVGILLATPDSRDGYPTLQLESLESTEKGRLDAAVNRAAEINKAERLIKNH